MGGHEPYHLEQPPSPLQWRVLRAFGWAQSGGWRVDTQEGDLTPALAWLGWQHESRAKSAASLCRLLRLKSGWWLYNQSSWLLAHNMCRLPPGARVALTHGDEVEFAFVSLQVDLQTIDTQSQPAAQTANEMTKQSLSDLILAGRDPGQGVMMPAGFLAAVPSSGDAAALSLIADAAAVLPTATGDDPIDHLHQAYWRKLNDPDWQPDVDAMAVHHAQEHSEALTKLFERRDSHADDGRTLYDWLRPGEPKSADAIESHVNDDVANAYLSLPTADELLHLFAPTAWQGAVSRQLPTLTRREHHRVSPDSAAAQLNWVQTKAPAGAKRGDYESR